MTKQCPSCGGICKPSGCERENVNQTWWHEPAAKMNYRQWQGLTEEEIENMMDYWSEPARSAYGGAHTANGEYVCIADIIRDAEAKLKAKNS